jgi:nucleoside-diphosphate-sugar epimerase
MNKILITGGAGVVGGAVVAELLNNPQWEIVLLLRPTADKTVPRRLEELRTYWREGGATDAALARVSAVPGDVTADRLGLSPEDHAALHRSTTHLLHGAANVKVNMSREEAHRSSVATTVRALEFAAGAPLQKFEYISTVGVGGKMVAPLPERQISEAREYHNTYESSKAEAEDLVWRAADKGLPVTVHRPSMIVGDSRTGRVRSFQIFYHLMEMLSGRAGRGWVPRLPGFRLDVIPCDYVARAVAASLARPAWAGRVLNLSAGPAGSWSLESYVERLPGLFRDNGVPTPDPRRIPWPVFRAMVPVLSRVGPQKQRVQFKNLPHFLRYLGSKMVFGNTGTVQTLAEAGVRLPAMDRVLPAIVRFYLAAWKARRAGDFSLQTGL